MKKIILLIILSISIISCDTTVKDCFIVNSVKLTSGEGTLYEVVFKHEYLGCGESILYTNIKYFPGDTLKLCK